MSRFNNVMSDGWSKGRGNGKGGGRGAPGLRLRDGSCQGGGQGRRLRQFSDVSGFGVFNRFFADGNCTRGASSSVGASGLLSVIRDLQQQIDELKRQSGK